MIHIYAGTTSSNLTELPSPVSVKPSYEMIWSENTGRAQSGANQAKMVGDVVAEKCTYRIQWGILTQTEFNTIKSKLPKGFFYFKCGENASNPSKYYRSEISADMIVAGSTTYYKDVSVSVIEQ